MSAALSTVWLPLVLRRQLWAHARREQPRECVGVLGGTSSGEGWQAQVYVPLPNVAERAEVQYRADPAALIRALRELRAQQLSLVGLFHSHPRGPQQPSATDIAAASYAVPYLIVDLSAGTLRGFLLPEGAEVAVRPRPGCYPELL
ncbi:M67 family metallopeptidase [Deinococcus sp. Marseille-Q6407]|uniref:M67 family metallopeptidase n=1 Tax=Deinococcus sp. Marseille-Q6407 TaxID=2969223 RepID=UPI0021C04404|nr:M67 family metallopeptidase [Deinococcus sp. Marseille-Q6407]